MDSRLVHATPLSPELIAQLKNAVGGRFSDSAAICEQHGHDESFHPGHAPQGVVFPSTTEEVAAVVKHCVAAKLPVIAYGRGTSLEGQVAAINGGICLDLSGLDKILSVFPGDLIAHVQAGVTRKQLNSYLRDTGLFFPVDPGADASLGGMAATRASGTNAVRYGTMRDNVVSLTAVLASGEIVHTGRRARKSAAGYDLTGLIVGSEGTLGIITELSVRLYGVPEAVLAMVCPFKDIAGAVEAVIATIQNGLAVARIEFLDEMTMRACNTYANLDYPEQPTLMLEFHGTPASAKETAGRFEEIAGEFGGGPTQSATREEERNRLWQARHDAYYASLRLEPGKQGYVTDVCVPISRLAECILQTRADIDASPLTGPIVGHVGDGNFHTILLVDPAKPETIAEAERLHGRMVERALSMDGTCTGEHGVGLGKRQFMMAEHGAPGVAMMRALKSALDPHNLLNPGKII
jgi:D-lactate dehydrogenase (cytochrome)